MKVKKPEIQIGQEDPFQFGQIAFVNARKLNQERNYGYNQSQLITAAKRACEIHYQSSDKVMLCKKGVDFVLKFQ